MSSAGHESGGAPSSSLCHLSVPGEIGQDVCLGKYKYHQLSGDCWTSVLSLMFLIMIKFTAP